MSGSNDGPRFTDEDKRTLERLREQVKSGGFVTNRDRRLLKLYDDVQALKETVKEMEGDQDDEVGHA
jgi:hypothetical protein